jgi:hypothetical protein
MDEDLLTIRRALHSGPPSGEAKNRARDLLTAEMAADHVPGAVPSVGYVRSASPKRSWWGRGAVLSGGLAALIVAGVLAVPALRGPGHDAPGNPPHGTAPRTAQELLLAAAERAATGPEGTGKYWHVRQVSVAGPIKVGSYDLVGRWLYENWTARDPSVSSWTGSLDLGFKPRTKADEDAWEAAGAPTSWTVPGDTTSGKVTYTSSPGTPTLTKIPTSGRAGVIEGLPEPNQLPADPVELRSVVLASVPDLQPEVADVTLFSVLSGLLLDSPAPAAVRAAAFTLLADIPGVRSAGDVTDANGRTGTGIELTRQHATNITSRNLLVIDPKTYLILARETSGTLGTNTRPLKASNTLVLAAEWTGTEPTLPKAP